jgi:2,2-dialkylglycine decarboxylase (pyruvate)
MPDPAIPSNEPMAELRQVVKDHMLRYGGEFAPWFAVKAEGAYLWDHTGRKILDFCSGQMCATLGHNHPAVVAAIEKSCREVLHLFSGILAPVVVELARELTRLLPASLGKVAFANTGGESNELALRLAKMHTGRYEIVALTGSWHGQTAGAASVTYNGGRKGYGPVMPGQLALPAPNCYRCPVRHCDRTCDMTCLEVGFAMVDSQSTGQPAALIAEPIQSSGGVIVPPEGYFKRLKELCAERGMLLLIDEAQTAWRVGSNFAFEQMGFVPDILQMSKTLGGGLPLSATATGAAIEEDCVEKGFLFYTSHISDPLPAYVGLAVLAVLEKERLTERAAELGKHLLAGFADLKRRHERVGDVRGLGLLAGIELVKDRHTREPARDFARAVHGRALELGLVLNVVKTSNANTLRFAPPLTITKAELESGLAILDQALADCAKKAA